MLFNIRAQSLWNRKTNYDDVLQDICKTFYGNASQSMLAYYRHMHSQMLKWELPEGHPTPFVGNAIEYELPEVVAGRYHPYGNLRPTQTALESIRSGFSLTTRPLSGVQFAQTTSGQDRCHGMITAERRGTELSFRSQLLNKAMQSRCCVKENYAYSLVPLMVGPDSTWMASRLLNSYKIPQSCGIKLLQSKSLKCLM